MARMIPDVEPDGLEHASEIPVYRALRDGLDNDFRVLHSHQWLRPWRGDGALAEGETDFVILHPEHGLLVLEVKGGARIRHDGHRWLRGTQDGPQEFRDPFDQARRNMHALLDLIEERSGGRIMKNSLVHGYAVVFPDLDYTGNPPPNADRAIIISRRDLPSIQQSVIRAFQAWTAVPIRLPRDRFAMMFEDCLLPKFRMFRPLGADLTADAEQLIELTKWQAEVFEDLHNHDRVLVEGVAGSGKTFLAVQRALAFARGGKRTLLVCFNRALAEWIRRQLERDPRTADYRSLLTVRHFHALASDLADDAGLAFEPDGRTSPDNNFWDNTVPDLLEEAALLLDDRGKDVMYDALVVDEAQDFLPRWWEALTKSLLKSPGGSPVHAFLDPNQSLRQEMQRPPIDLGPPHMLTRNCRNTRRINAASCSILELEAKFYERAPTGAKPRLLHASARNEQKAVVLGELQRLLKRERVAPGQIALIGPGAKERGSLAGLDKAAGVPLTTSIRDWWEGAGLLVTTARSFKGLEADVVLLYDLSEFGKLFRREDLYVACTRAKTLLIAVVHGRHCHEALKAAFAAADAQS